MTNEEKAAELDKRVNNKQVNVYAWTLQMANWKDKQFKEYLEKKKESMLKKWGHLVAAEVSTLNMIINEFFGGELNMKSTKENTVIPPCCQSCVAEGSIDEARLAMNYENGRDDARREFKEYLEKKKDVENELAVANADNDKRWNRHDAKRKMLCEIINELFEEEKCDGN